MKCQFGFDNKKVVIYTLFELEGCECVVLKLRLAALDGQPLVISVLWICSNLSALDRQVRHF